MTRPIRLTILALLLAGAALAAAVPMLLPPGTAGTPAPHWDDPLTVRGAYHVHSVVSDGTGTLDEIAAAASHAGLRFVILTDHGDDTRTPGPPRYRSGVLCIEAVEINTASGHLVALGARPSPYPLAGTADAVLEDVHRLGGIGIAAHPDSPRASLQWTDWTTPVDGIEWLNADSEWRDELLASLGRGLLTYSLRPAETLTATLDRPVGAFSRWDALTAERRVVGLAGADAHARLGFRQQVDPYQPGWSVPVPSYQASFQAFGIRVQLGALLTGDAERDAAHVLDRIREGRVYSVVDGLATPGAFDFTASSGGRNAAMGDYLTIAGEVGLHVRMAAPPGARLTIIRNGVTFVDSRDNEAHVGVPAEAAVYRVEVHVPSSAGRPPIPWLVSNPIYVGMQAAHEAAGRQSVARLPSTRRTAVDTAGGGIEASPGSTSVLHPTGLEDGAAHSWDFQLAGGVPAGQFAAARFPVAGLTGHDRFEIAARSSQPMRIWVQVRASATTGDRWGRSIYLDERTRPVDILFRDLQPLGPTSSPTPPLAEIDAILLVADTVNARPGDRGTVHLSELWLAQ